MPLINTTFYADGKQNFLVPENNTNSFDNDLINNSAIFSEEGVASGFHIAQTTSPSNQVQIKFSTSLASKNGKVGTVVVKTPSNEFLVLALRSATALNVDIPENTTAFTRYDLICVYADFRTAAANNFSIKYFSGDTTTDPDLDAWNAANSGQILLPIARIAKTPGSLVDSSQIILSGQTTYNVDKSVRQTVRYIAGSIKVMTEAERDASSWNSGDLCLVKAPLDVNNTLHINTSTTATPLWKQIVLLAQLASQWSLLVAQNMGTGATAPFTGTFTITEGMGTPTGGFTLPASFFGVGTSLILTWSHNFTGGGSSQSAANLLILQLLTHSFRINGATIFSNQVGRKTRWTGSQKYNPYASGINNSGSISATLSCVQIIGNVAKLQVVTESYDFQATGFSTSDKITFNQQNFLIDVNQASDLVCSIEIVKSKTAYNGSTAVESSENATLNSLATYSIQKQV